MLFYNPYNPPYNPYIMPKNENEKINNLNLKYKMNEYENVDDLPILKNITNIIDNPIINSIIKNFF